MNGRNLTNESVKDVPMCSMLVKGVNSSIWYHLMHSGFLSTRSKDFDFDAQKGYQGFAPMEFCQERRRFQRATKAGENSSSWAMEWTLNSALDILISLDLLISEWRMDVDSADRLVGFEPF